MSRSPVYSSCVGGTGTSAHGQNNLLCLHWLFYPYIIQPWHRLQKLLHNGNVDIQIVNNCFVFFFVETCHKGELSQVLFAG